MAIFSDPVQLYLENLVLPAFSLDVLKKVIAALSAGELAKAGSITTLASPASLTVGVAVTVYILSIPATLNTSPSCGVEVKPSTARVVPVCDPAFTRTVPYTGTFTREYPVPDVLSKLSFLPTITESRNTPHPTAR